MDKTRIIRVNDVITMRIEGAKLRIVNNKKTFMEFATCPPSMSSDKSILKSPNEMGAASTFRVKIHATKMRINFNII
jgi:hypothetical protein